MSAPVLPAERATCAWPCLTCFSQGESCVSDLEAALGIHQPTLSQQLAVLRSEELVSTRREGKNIYYAIARPDVLRLLQTLHELHCAQT